MTWNSDIPLLSNQLSADWPDINENFTHLKDMLANIVNSWDNTTPTNMYMAKTKRTYLLAGDSPYTMLETDVLMECNPVSGPITINAVSASTLGAGRYFMIVVTNASNTVTLDPYGSETIDGNSSLEITGPCGYIIYSSGSNLRTLLFRPNQSVDSGSDPVFGDPAAVTLTLTGAPTGSPTANKLYKHNIPKAWINFNGTGTIAVNDHFNVQSITDNGTGDYTITWDTDFANANYAVAGVCSGTVASGNGYAPHVALYYSSPLAVGSARIVTAKNGGDGSWDVAVDSAIVTVIAMGDQ